MMEATAFFGRPDAVVVLITSEVGHKQASCRPRSPAMSAHLAFVDNAHFAQESGAFRPHLLPNCYHFLLLMPVVSPNAPCGIGVQKNFAVAISAVALEAP